MFAFMRPSLSDLGMTITPCCTPQLSATCAGVALFSLAIRTSAVSSSSGDGVPA